jgi:hypothetical protein
MTDACTQYKNLIPRALVADLSPEEQQRLDQHLAECRPCEREQRLYAETVRKLRTSQDEPIPRHFFVYPEEARVSPWQAFLRMPRAWQAAVASAVLALGFLSTAGLARLQVRTEGGAVMFGFGRLPDRASPEPKAPQIDTQALESRLLNLVEEKSRRDAAEWMRTLRTELARSSKAIGREQSILLAQALDNLEARMGTIVAATAADLEKRNDRSIDNLYTRISTERNRDLAAVQDRIDLLAVNGEMKSSQTDVILQTLLQVAELRLR